MENRPHQTVVVHLLTTRDQQLKVQAVTPANQIIVLTTNPNIPFNFRIKEIKSRLGRET